MDISQRMKKIKTQDFKNILSNYVKGIDDYTIFLSSGVDSRALFFESLEQNKNFNVISFKVKGFNSIDFNEAKNLCEKYAVEFIGVELSDNLQLLVSDIKEMINFGCKSKTDFECFWPFFKSYHKSKNNILSGLAADGNFCLSKKGMIHYKTYPKIDEFRYNYFNKPNIVQRLIHENYCKVINKNHFMPFLEKEMVDLFMGTDWFHVNKPREKFVIWDAYRNYYKEIKSYKHSNLQLGVSGISETFSKLVELEELNPGKKFKSVIGVLNRIIKNHNQKSLF